MPARKRESRSEKKEHKRKIAKELLEIYDYFMALNRAHNAVGSLFRAYVDGQGIKEITKEYASTVLLDDMMMWSKETQTGIQEIIDEFLRQLGFQKEDIPVPFSKIEMLAGE